MKQADPALAEIRAIHRRLVDAHTRLGQVDYAMSKLEHERTIARTDVEREDRELQRLVSAYAQAKGVNVANGGAWKLNPETGEIVQGA